MNVRIFWVRAIECTCAQTRPRFNTLIRKSVWGMESEPILTPRGKSPLPEKKNLRGGWNPRRCIKQNNEPNTLPTSCSGPKELYDYYRMLPTVYTHAAVMMSVDAPAATDRSEAAHIDTGMFRRKTFASVFCLNICSSTLVDISRGGRLACLSWLQERWRWREKKREKDRTGANFTCGGSSYDSW